MTAFDYIVLAVGGFVLVIAWREVLKLIGFCLIIPWAFLLILFHIISSDKNPLRWAVLCIWAVLAYLTYKYLQQPEIAYSFGGFWTTWGVYQLCILLPLVSGYGYLTGALKQYFENEAEKKLTDQYRPLAENRPKHFVPYKLRQKIQEDADKLKTNYHALEPYYKKSTSHSVVFKPWFGIGAFILFSLLWNKTSYEISISVTASALIACLIWYISNRQLNKKIEKLEREYPVPGTRRYQYDNGRFELNIKTGVPELVFLTDNFPRPTGDPFDDEIYEIEPEATSLDDLKKLYFGDKNGSFED